MTLSHPSGRFYPLRCFWVALLLSLSEPWLSSLALAQSPGTRSTTPTTLPQTYLEAVEDARVAEPREIYRNLTPIVWYHPGLVWDKSRVLVTVWTTYPGYTSQVNRLMRLPVDLWVTAAPDLQNFCKAYRPTSDVSLPDRLNQLLGLPPDPADRTRYVVELWVEPKYLFRPSPDPDISDREATLEFPSNPFESITTSYQTWFNTQFTSRYPATGTAYPWTQLGYTYDWGNPTDWQRVDANRPPRVGLSEFVVRQGGVVSVRSTQTVAAYCQSGNP